MPKNKTAPQPASPAVSGFRARIAAAFDAFRGKSGFMGDPYAENAPGWRGVGGVRHVRYANSNQDWGRRAGILWHNPAIGLCVQFLFDKLGEVHPEIMKRGAGKKWTADDTGPDPEIIKLLRDPNPEYDGATLLQSAALSFKLGGEAYIIQTRKGGPLGVTGELWYVPHWQMTPEAPEDGGPTQVYRRDLPGGKREYYAAGNVIHIKNGMDPQNPRRGMNTFYSLCREIVTDSDLSTFCGVVVGNMGVTSGIVAASDIQAPLDETNRRDLKGLLDNQSTHDGAGGWIVSALPVSVQRAGLTPDEMAVDQIGKRPEARICAGFGFNPMALGLPADDKKFANLKESREAAVENGIKPFLAAFEKALTRDLLPEFDARAEKGKVKVHYCTDEMADLQPDKDKEHNRWRSNFQRGICLLSEARAGIGLENDKGQDGEEAIDGYFWQLAPAVKATSEDDKADKTDDGSGGGGDNGE